MAQHDNGRRVGGTQSGAWQQGHRDPQDFSNHPQDTSFGGRHGGQQGGHPDFEGRRWQQDQYGYGRAQQGDNWRERQGPAAGGWRPAMEERDRDWDSGRGGQGSFGGQASDNDYGNRGITESGNFRNYGARGRNAGPTSGRAWADDDAGPSNRDRYGDNGYQGNWTQGQRGQSYHDPDYHQWRSEQLNRLDRDYEEWRQHRYQRFADDFDTWRANRGSRGASNEVSGQQAGTSGQDASNGGDKGAGKTATK